MFRLLPLLFLALLPAAVAAPIPRDALPDFGLNGLLSRADLEKVRFDSQPVKEDGRRPREKLADDNAEEKLAPGAPRNRFDVAVHMPWTKFRVGEPIPAYFVLRNNRNTRLGLTSRLDFSGPTPTMQGGAVSFDIRDRATGKSVIQLQSHVTNCGGGSLVDVPSNGFWVIRSDLNHAAGVSLPAGDYEVDWEYFPLRSAPVRFTVENADAPKPAAAKRSTFRFYHLMGRFDGEELPKNRGEPFVGSDSRLDPTSTPGMAAALAVGQHGVYVPDIRTIPAADKLVAAWAEWKPYRDGDRLVVTLRAALPNKEVRFEQLPELFLQLETRREDDSGRWLCEPGPDRKQSARADEVLATPLTMEVKLPPDWRERVAATDTARVAVLVSAKRLEIPRGGGKVLEQLAQVRDLRAGDPPLVWSGVVRTDFVELRFPPEPPRLEK